MLNPHMSRAGMGSRIALIVALFGAALEGRSPADDADAAPKVSRDQVGGADRIVATELPPAVMDALRAAELDADQWRRVLAVHVDGAGDESLPAMLGESRLEGERILFEPRFPLQAGLTYRVEIDLSHMPGGSVKSSPIVLRLSIPEAPAGPVTKIVQVYPTRATLPENQLKFYVQFSGPMRRGEAYRRVRLFDETRGAEVEYPFLELGEELWSPDGTRFTLFFDPGRIKRGLRPREEVGPSLEAGHAYTLTFDAAWQDASGRPLADGVRKRFKVGPPDDTQPDVQRWTVDAPRAQTVDPLVVTFDEPFDRGMLERVLVVRTAGGDEVRGAVTIDREETRWSFIPVQVWVAGSHEITIDAGLEDLAGNSLARPFEVDVLRPIEREIARETVTVPFTVGTAKDAK